MRVACEAAGRTIVSSAMRSLSSRSSPWPANRVWPPQPRITREAGYILRAVRAGQRFRHHDARRRERADQGKACKSTAADRELTQLRAGDDACRHALQGRSLHDIGEFDRRNVSLCDRGVKFNHRDYTPLAALIGTYYAVAVRADSPYKTLGDLVKDLKERPEKTPICGGTSDDRVFYGAMFSRPEWTSPRSST